MNRINKIIFNNEFKQAVKANAIDEKGRIYCLHNFEHSTDVARICYIICLENKLEIKKDVIYAAALLHDIGRFKQYEENIPHQQASIEIAQKILPLADYTEAEIDEILLAIDCHRNGKTKNKLGEVLQKADNLSRLCFKCQAKSTCKWSAEEINSEMEY